MIIIPMETVQIRLIKKQIREIDLLVRNGLYPSRSEVMRDALRRLIISLNRRGSKNARA